MRLFRRFAVAALVLSAGFAVASADEKTKPDEKKAEAKAAVAVPAIRIAAAPANPAEKFETTHKVVGAIDVKGDKGDVVHWATEMSNPFNLQALGHSRKELTEKFAPGTSR